jgi:hypothetical protein
MLVGAAVMFQTLSFDKPGSDLNQVTSILKWSYFKFLVSQGENKKRPPFF